MVCRLPIVFFGALFFVTTLLTSPASAIEFGHLDDFSNGTAGWAGGANPIVVDDGGPLGAGDAFLQLQPVSSRIAAFNLSETWTGDFLSAGVTQVTGDFRHQDESPLDLRVVLFHGATRWTSLEAISLPGDDQWHSFTFSLLEEDMSLVRGSDDFATTITSVDRFMVRHQMGNPAAGGSRRTGSLDIDNLLATSASTTPACDFDGDDLCTVTDIDSLVIDIANGTNSPEFDLTNDDLTNKADRDLWLELAGSENGFSSPYKLGDATLDGKVNIVDLNQLAKNWMTDTAEWSRGNFTDDGRVDIGDLNELAQNWGSDIGAAVPAAVPEPASGWLLAALLTPPFLRMVFS